MFIRTPGSGQDGGNKNWSDTALINKAFNDHNSNEGLDKSKVAFVSSKIDEEDDPLYKFFKGAGDVAKDVVKAIDAPVVNAIGNYLKDPKNADNVKAMQEQLSKNFEVILKAFGMNYDERAGQWYSDDKGVQQYGGYADFYDLLTPLLGFDVDTTKVEFNYDGKDYTFRPWFGCYGAYSLAPGGENGIYEDNGAWYTKMFGIDDAAQDRKTHMNVQLYDRSGNLIMSTDDHGKKRYWQFGSNPMAGVQDKSNLYMEATLSCKPKDINFMQTLADEANKQGVIKFGKLIPVVDAQGNIDHYEVTYTYDPNGILSGGGVAGGGYGGGGASSW